MTTKRQFNKPPATSKCCAHIFGALSNAVVKCSSVKVHDKFIELNPCILFKKGGCDLLSRVYKLLDKFGIGRGMKNSQLS